MTSAVQATRQAVGVPSAWSQPFQSTHKRPRRWCDAGSLGRPSVTAAQKAGAAGGFRGSGRQGKPGRRPSILGVVALGGRRCLLGSGRHIDLALEESAVLHDHRGCVDFAENLGGGV